MIQQAERVEVATYEKPKKGNYHSGDSYFYIETEEHFLVALSDDSAVAKLPKSLHKQSSMSFVGTYIDHWMTCLNNATQPYSEMS